MINKNYSGLKICWHPEKLKALKDNNITPPIYVRIKPTNICNHKCFYCSYQEKNNLVLSECFNFNDSLSYDTIMQLLVDLHSMGVKAVTYSGGGEPLLYKHIEEVFQKTLQYEIDLSVITNGQYLNGAKADLLKNAKWVRVSIETVNENTFKKIRGLDGVYLQEILRNIKTFAKLKNNACELGINFVVTQLNYGEIYEAAEIFKESGVNHIKFTALITNNTNEYHKSIKEEACLNIKKAEEDFSADEFNVLDKYSGDFEYAVNDKRVYAKCPISQIVTVVGADGGVYLCHDKTYTKDGYLGLLSEKTFKDIWFSAETRKKFNEFDAAVMCKHHCTYDERNIFINDVLLSAGEHENFI